MNAKHKILPRLLIIGLALTVLLSPVLGVMATMDAHPSLACEPGGSGGGCGGGFPQGAPPVLMNIMATEPGGSGGGCGGG